RSAQHQPRQIQKSEEDGAAEQNDGAVLLERIFEGSREQPQKRRVFFVDCLPVINKAHANAAANQAGMGVAGPGTDGLDATLAQEGSALIADERSQGSRMVATIIRSARRQRRRFDCAWGNRWNRRR